jgi:transposase-like protein
MKDSKQCPRCKEVKDRSKYNKSNAKLDKMAIYCKDCERVYKKKRNEERKLNDLYGII